MAKRVVIVGASHAGMAAAAKLRALDPHGEITLISADPAHPYQRPALSKTYLSGKAELAAIALRPASWFSENAVTLVQGMTVLSINRQVSSVLLADGRQLPYDALILATGATARPFPPDKGGTLGGVHTMRNLSDANRLKLDFADGKRLVVIGGGYIGLEAASEARKKGLDVTVLEAADRIVKRVAASETSDYLRCLHTNHGVVIRENVQIERIVGDGDRVCGVELAVGEVVPADLVVVGIGISPNTDLAVQAGLVVSNGIEADAFLRTSDPSIFAIGDCAAFPYQSSRIRLESVQNANDQGAAAALNIAGCESPYRATPWFWSDQFDMKLQIAGLNTGYDDVLIQSGSGAVRSHFYFRNGAFLAADCFNDPVTFAMSRKLLDSGKVLAREQAGQAGFSMRAFVMA